MRVAMVGGGGLGVVGTRTYLRRAAVAVAALRRPVVIALGMPVFMVTKELVAEHVGNERGNHPPPRMEIGESPAGPGEDGTEPAGVERESARLHFAILRPRPPQRT